MFCFCPLYAFPLLFIDTGSILQRLFLAQKWKVQWCYLCLPLSPLLFTSLSFPAICLPWQSSPQVQPLLTSCTLPLIGKWWWDRKSSTETMHSGKRRRDLSCGRRETTREWEPSVFFMHFYHMSIPGEHYVSACLCLSLPLVLCFSLCCHHSVRFPSSPPHHCNLLNLLSPPSSVSPLLSSLPCNLSVLCR